MMCTEFRLGHPLQELPDVESWETKGAQCFTCINSGNNCQGSNVLELRNELVDTIPTQRLYGLIVLHCSPASFDKNSSLF